MQKLIQGIHQFQQEAFRAMEGLFSELANGQSPDTLFITCSDSRIDPNLITKTVPGELFVIRNAGNLVPAYDGQGTAESATIEYAVNALNVKDIIICGHSQCGAMGGLHTPGLADQLPLVASWLSHAEDTRKIVEEKYQELEGQPKVDVTIQENVLVQLKNLCTHPSVQSKLSSGDLHLHGWVYTFETGDVSAYAPQTQQFVSIADYKTPDEEPDWNAASM